MSTAKREEIRPTMTIRDIRNKSNFVREAVIFLGLSSDFQYRMPPSKKKVLSARQDTRPKPNPSSGHEKIGILETTGSGQRRFTFRTSDFTLDERR